MAEYIRVPAGVYDMVTRCMEQEFPDHGAVLVVAVVVFKTESIPSLTLYLSNWQMFWKSKHLCSMMISLVSLPYPIPKH